MLLAGQVVGQLVAVSLSGGVVVEFVFGQLGAVQPTADTVTTVIEQTPAGLPVRLIERLFSPDVDASRIPPPIEKKVLELVGVAPVVEAKALLDFILGGAKKGNPARAELPPGVDPQGRPYPPAAIVGGGGPLPPANVLPMWNADP